MTKRKPERIRQTPVTIPIPLTESERIIADKYNPFKDPNPPNYLKYGKRIKKPFTRDVGVRVQRVIKGVEVTIEYRGTFPAYMFGNCGVVGGYDTARFYARHPRLAKKAGKAVE